MPDRAKIVTTDAETEAATRQARVLSKYDQRVARASYSAKNRRLSLRLENGAFHTIPIKLLQGLSEASPSELSRIELLGHGAGLYWPALDVAHLVSGLLANLGAKMPV